MQRPPFRLGPGDHQSVGSENEHATTDEQLTSALIAVHEQLLQTSDVGGPSSGATSSASSQNIPIDAAEFDDLTFCLEQLELARRFGSGDAPVRKHELVADLAALMAGACAPADSVEPAPAENQPARIGRFEIVRELGRGGLGVVLLAYDPVLKRQVALKLPNPEGMISPSLRRRFQREGHAAARLLHPHIVPVYEVGEIGPLCFIAAAYVEGPNLAQWLAEQSGPCSPRVAASLVAELADAMDYAHEQQILHRDLKPSNVLLERTPAHQEEGLASGRAGRLSAKITDFGLAKLLDQTDDETRHGTVLGTPAYMAPEQARADTTKIGRACDVYSLGAILYEMLTGRAPYPADSVAGALVQLLGPEMPLPLRRTIPSLSRDLEAIVHRCLEKEPANRYASAGELAADLRRYLAGEPTQARPLSPVQRLARWSRRKPALAALVGVSLAATIALALGGVFYARELNRAVIQSVEAAYVAQGLRAEAVTQERRANEQLYVAHMRLTDLALRDGDPTRARILLDRYLANRYPSDFRGMEWYVLRSQLLRMDNMGEGNATITLDHPTEVYAAVALADSGYVASGAKDGRLRIWDHARRIVVHDLPAHKRCLNQIRLSPDGLMLATASCDHTAAVWRLSSENLPKLEQVLNHDDPVRRIDWSPDGQRLATTTSKDDYQLVDGQLQIWDLRSGERIHQRSCQASVGLFWSPDGKQLVTVGAERVRSLRTSDWTQEVDLRAQRLRSAALHPGGALTVYENRLGVCELDLSTGRQRLLFPTNREGMLAWTPTATSIAISDAHSMIRVFYPEEAYRQLSFFQHHRISRISDVGFSRDSRYLISTEFSGRVCVTDWARCERVGASAIHRLPTYVRLAPYQLEADGSHATMRAEDGESFRLDINWDAPASPKNGLVNSSKYPRRLPATDIKFKAGTRRVEQTAEGWPEIRHLDEGRSERLPFQLAGKVHQSGVFDHANCAVVLHDDQLTVFGLTPPRMIYSDRDTAFAKPTIRDEHELDLSADGRWLVTTTEPTGVLLVDLVHGTKKLLWEDGDVLMRLSNLTISSNGRHAAMILLDSEVSIWDIASAKVLHSVDVGDFAHCLAFDPHGRSLAVGTNRGLQIWYAETGERIVNIHVPNGITATQFSADGRTLYCASSDGNSTEIYRWSMDDAMFAPEGDAALTVRDQ